MSRTTIPLLIAFAAVLWILASAARDLGDSIGGAIEDRLVATRSSGQEAL